MKLLECDSVSQLVRNYTVYGAKYNPVNLGTILHRYTHSQCPFHTLFYNNLLYKTSSLLFYNLFSPLITSALLVYIYSGSRSWGRWNQRK